MNRRGFLGALVGVPFIAGWVKKLDASGEREVAVIEPVAAMGVSEYSDASGTTVSITTTHNDANPTTWVIYPQSHTGETYCL